MIILIFRPLQIFSRHKLYLLMLQRQDQCRENTLYTPANAPAYINDWSGSYIITRTRMVQTQISTRDTRYPIPPRVMASSACGSVWESSGCCRPHTHTRKCKTNAFTIFALHAQTAVHAGNMYAPDEADYFDYGKNLKTRNLSPMPGSRWHRFRDLSCISVSTDQLLMYVRCHWHIIHRLQPLIKKESKRTRVGFYHTFILDANNKGTAHPGWYRTMLITA